MKFFRWIFVLLVLVGAVLFFSSEFNREMVFRTSGVVDSGQKFGIQIGMPITDVRKYLEKKGFVPLRYEQKTACLGVKTSGDEVAESWIDWQWHRGSLCVFSKSGSVSRISWQFGHFI